MPVGDLKIPVIFVISASGKYSSFGLLLTNASFRSSNCFIIPCIFSYLLRKTSLLKLECGSWGRVKGRPSHLMGDSTRIFLRNGSSSLILASDLMIIFPLRLARVLKVSEWSSAVIKSSLLAKVWKRMLSILYLCWSGSTDWRQKHDFQERWW